MTEVTTFEDGVKARIKSIIAELMPEERWSALVTAEMQHFERTDLPKIIQAELTERYRKLIVAELHKPEWAEKWDGELLASDAVRKLIIDATPAILTGLIGGNVQQIVQMLRSQLQHRTY